MTKKTTVEADDYFKKIREEVRIKQEQAIKEAEEAAAKQTVDEDDKVTEDVEKRLKKMK